jgi:hypothetical protein
MRPPICYICGKRFEPSAEVDIIYFKKQKSDIKWEKRMKREGKVGHPPYAEWFCEEHYEAANKLKHLPINEALKLLESL